MSKSKNIGMSLISENDTTTTVKQWISDVNGENENSNTQIIDREIARLDSDIKTVKGEVNIALTSHNTDITAHPDIREEMANKADLVNGKVLETQLPELDYDTKGTAAGVQGNLTFHNTDTTAHQDIRNDLKLKADLQDGKILDTQLPDMDYVPTSRTINGVALTKDITLTPANVNAAALDLSNVANDVFYKKAKEAGM